MLRTMIEIARWHRYFLTDRWWEHKYLGGLKNIWTAMFFGHHLLCTVNCIQDNVDGLVLCSLESRHPYSGWLS